MKRTLFTLALLFTSMIGMAQVQMQRMQSNDTRESIKAFAQQKRTHEPVRFKEGTPVLSVNFSDTAAFTLGITPSVHGVQYEPYRFVRMTDSTKTAWTEDYTWTGRYWGMTRDLGFSIVSSNMGVSSEELSNGFLMVTPLDAVLKDKTTGVHGTPGAKIALPPSIPRMMAYRGHSHLPSRSRQIVMVSSSIGVQTDYLPRKLWLHQFQRKLRSISRYCRRRIDFLPHSKVNIPTVGQA